MSAATSEAMAEPRLLRGLVNIIRALRLPRGTNTRTVAAWLKKHQAPVFRVGKVGPYFADPDQLASWWRTLQTSATATLNSTPRQ